jgi:hypothetical protein
MRAELAGWMKATLLASAAVVASAMSLIAFTTQY